MPPLLVQLAKDVHVLVLPGTKTQMSKRWTIYPIRTLGSNPSEPKGGIVQQPPVVWMDSLFACVRFHFASLLWLSLHVHAMPLVGTNELMLGMPVRWLEKDSSIRPF